MPNRGSFATIPNPLPVSQGGTGSTTQTFVDTTTDQSISGNKTFVDALIVATPTSNDHAVTKLYADSISSGLTVRQSVAATTALLLPANTYANGTLGVGATLTATLPGILIVDGYTVLLNDRVLVKNEVAPANNGIYTLTTLGTVSVAYVLTRATDIDQAAEISGSATFTNFGSVNFGSGWAVIGGGPYTIGTTAINWTQFSTPGFTGVGTGLSASGNTVSLIVPVTVVDGGTGSTTASGARTNLGLGTAAVEDVSTLAANTAPLGVQSAGSVGQVSDAGHVHAMPTLSQVGAPTVDLSMGSHKITNLTNGSVSTDAAAFGQVPTTLPPSGSASGDLTGTYPGPTLSNTANVQSVVRTNRLDQMATPTAPVGMGSQKITGLANGTVGTDAAAFGQIPSSLPPNGSASGDLTGAYPAPTLANTANVQSVVRTNRLDQMAAPTAAVPFNSQKITGLANGTVSTDGAAFGQIPTTLPPNGSASGDLSGTYPSPTVSKVNGVTVSGTPAFGTPLRATTASTAIWSVLPNFMNTGVLTGGVMTQNGGNVAAFDITATTAYIVDYVTTPAAPVITPVTINAQTVTLSGAQLTRNVNWWVSDSAGVITALAVQPTPVQRRTSIALGVTWSTTGTGALFNIESVPTVLNQPTANLNGLAYALGTLNISGNVISANGANLNLNKTAGTLHALGFNYASGGANSPNLVTSPIETAGSFRYVTQLTSSVSASRTTMDVANYDVAGTITAIPGTAGTSSLHRVFLMPSGVAGAQILIQYGQATYASLANAIAAAGSESFVINPDIDSYGVLIAYIACTKSATSLNNAGQATFKTAAKFATP